MRVVCAMSGGVDSSLAAALMVEAGHEVVGMTMRLYNASEAPGKGRGGTCCSPAEVDQAREVCDQLGVRHYTVDESERFSEHVIGDFAREYASGRRPNPCV
ncbi:MAG: asparagine synthase-related protein, partial [Nannocystaceae bacterium]